ncbi:chitobiase/beta-hexosaminidase C-terminal domain-containing protein [Planctomycetota bacterium]
MKSIRLISILFSISFGAAAIAQVRPAYETEVWPETRTLIWAHPGVTGELGDPNNWLLENGDPVKTAPDKDTDVVLPPSDTDYVVNAKFLQVRHATIESGGLLIGKHRGELEVFGNLWAKPGGRAYFVAIRGPKHTFFRNDDSQVPSAKHPVPYAQGRRGADIKENRSQISHKFQVCKYGGASVEFIGAFGVSDEIMIQRGHVIINGDLRWSGVTGKGALEVYDGAVLELQSGTTIGPLKGYNKKALFNVVLYPGARLQGGSSDRPLESDARVMLGFSDAPFGHTGLFASAGSTIEVFTKDPKQARLVFTSMTSDPTYCDANAKPVGDPAVGARDGLGINVYLIGAAQLDGVLFDYVARGGIRLKDENACLFWKNVSLGSHNAGELEALVAKAERLTTADKQGYDSKPLTIASLQGMEAYMQSHDSYKLSSSPEAQAKSRVFKKFQEMKPIVYKESVEVTLSCAMADAAIHYTTDGSTPKKTSPRYTQPITLTKTTVLRARAFKGGMPPSPNFSVTYTVE